MRFLLFNPFLFVVSALIGLITLFFTNRVFSDKESAAFAIFVCIVCQVLFYAMIKITADKKHNRKKEFDAVFNGLGCCPKCGGVVWWPQMVDKDKKEIIYELWCENNPSSESPLASPGKGNCDYHRVFN